MVGNMKTINIVKCIYTRRPYPSHGRKLCLVAVPGGARMSKIDILLCILAVEVYIVRSLAQVCRARHTGVSIGHVKATRVASIPVCETFVDIRKRLVLYGRSESASGWSYLGSKSRGCKWWWPGWATLLTAKPRGKAAAVGSNRNDSAALRRG